jgi:serine/threonine-protein kinase
MPDEGRVTDLLVQWEAAKRSSEPLTPRELCADWPEGLEELCLRIHLLEVADAIFDLETSTKSLSSAPKGKVPPARLCVEIPNHELIDVLGQGGMGLVYRARHTVLGREVALKVLRPGAPASPMRIRRFLREAQALARLRHASIVPIYDAGDHDGEFYFAMELLPGGSLARQKEPYYQDPARAAALVEKVAWAVQHAHEQGILHRDLKPGNILLDDAGEPMVADFGLARFLDLNGPDSSPDEDEGPKPPLEDDTALCPLTPAGVHPGTPAYMAPEQFHSESGAISPRTDVWALGVILYELLTGQLPFPEDDHSVRGGTWRTTLRRPAGLRPELDARLEAIVLACLRTNPDAEYSSAAAVAEDLGRWRRGEAVQAYPEGRLRSATRWGRRHTTATTAVALLCLLATILLVAIPQDTEQRAEREYRQALKDAEAKLEAGQAVTLVNASTTELPHRWRLGGGTAAISVQPKGQDRGPVYISSVRAPALLELFPAPKRAAYRIKAKMQQQTPAADVVDLGDSGIFFAYNQQPSASGTQHLFAWFCFADLGPRATSFKTKDGKEWSRARPGFACLGPSPLSPQVSNWSEAAAFVSYDPGDPAARPGPPRTFEIEVRPDRVWANWEKKDVDPTQATAMNDWFERLRQNPKREDLRGLNPPTPFQGAIGIYLGGTSISLQEFTIEPVDSNP